MGKIQVFQGIDEWRVFRKNLDGRSLGFVPTMGALHPGHASLVARSSVENEMTVASIFVNPTQFNDPKDLEKYPRTLERDLEVLEDSGASFALCPGSFDELYPDGYRYRLSESEKSRTLCGAHRPGHFDGVLTVVMKLLNLVSPTRAYFGEKDHQQLTLIQEMARAFFMSVEIVPCPTVREEDGLAMSSRNTLLSASDRTRAAVFPKILKNISLSAHEVAQALGKEGFEVDYIEERNERRYGAIRVGSVRLIDNFPISGVTQ